MTDSNIRVESLQGRLVFQDQDEVQEEPRLGTLVWMLQKNDRGEVALRTRHPAASASLESDCSQCIEIRLQD